MSVDPAHYQKLERMYSAAPTNAYYRPEIHIGEGIAEVQLAVRPDFFHAAHGVHGSVYFKLLDDACFFATSSLFDDVFMLTASFNLSLLRPVSRGDLIARGRVVHRSRRLVIADGILSDDRGREVARGTGTFLPSTIALDETLGYR
jgi:uncharacterized protein (TIGR00369 family)